VTHQATQENTYTSLEPLGDGTEDYFGPIHRRYFAANITREFGKPFISTEKLTLVIDTHAYPYAGSQPDTTVAQRFSAALEKLFSRDEAIHQAETLSILNEQLTRMKASDDFMPTLEKIRKSNEGDKMPAHPMVSMTVAAMIAEKPYKQNHENTDAVLAAATDEEREELQATLDILSQPNDDIDLQINSGRRTPEILISGTGLPKALKKLLAAGMVIRDMDLSYLHRNLTKWAAANPTMEMFIADELQPVARILEELEETRPYRPLKQKRKTPQSESAPE